MIRPSAIIGFGLGCILGVSLALVAKSTPPASASEDILRLEAMVAERLGQLEQRMDAGFRGLQLELTEGQASEPVAEQLVGHPELDTGAIAQRLQSIDESLRRLPQSMVSLQSAEIPKELRLPKQEAVVNALALLVSRDTAAANTELFGLSPSTIYAKYGMPSYVKAGEKGTEVGWYYSHTAQGLTEPVIHITFIGGLVSQVWFGQ